MLQHPRARDAMIGRWNLDCCCSHHVPSSLHHKENVGANKGDTRRRRNERDGGYNLLRNDEKQYYPLGPRDLKKYLRCRGHAYESKMRICHNHQWGNRPNSGGMTKPARTGGCSSILKAFAPCPLANDQSGPPSWPRCLLGRHV